MALPVNKAGFAKVKETICCNNSSIIVTLDKGGNGASVFNSCKKNLYTELILVDNYNDINEIRRFNPGMEKLSLFNLQTQFRS